MISSFLQKKIENKWKAVFQKQSFPSSLPPPKCGSTKGDGYKQQQEKLRLETRKKDSHTVTNHLDQGQETLISLPFVVFKTRTMWPWVARSDFKVESNLKGDPARAEECNQISLLTWTFLWFCDLQGTNELWLFTAVECGCCCQQEPMAQARERVQEQGKIQFCLS